MLGNDYPSALDFHGIVLMGNSRETPTRYYYYCLNPGCLYSTYHSQRLEDHIERESNGKT